MSRPMSATAAVTVMGGRTSAAGGAPCGTAGTVAALTAGTT